MKLWEEAVKIDLFGTEMYAFGLFCAIGALASALALGALCREGGAKKGGAALTFLMSGGLGLILSRLAFCLMNRSLGMTMPFSAWFRITEGGWSTAGLIFGALLGVLPAAALLRERRERLFDFVGLSLPLTLAAVRFGEGKIPGFNVSRPLPAGFPVGNLLTVQDTKYEDVFYLATWRIGCVFFLCLFLALTVFLIGKNRREGDTGTLFLLLCGAGGILLESLRYDHFLEFSFVRLEQVAYGLILVFGVARAIRSRKRGPAWPAIALTAAAIGVSAGVEFALDRTSISHPLLYAIMVAALALPVWMALRGITGKGTERA